MNEQQQKTQAMADISRASRAQELIDNSLYQEAITAMNAAMYTAFIDTKLDNEAERHELWQRMQLMKQFQGKFESIIKQGTKARQTLTLLDRAKKVTGL